MVTTTWAIENSPSEWRYETIEYPPREPNRWPRTKTYGRKATNRALTLRKRLCGHYYGDYNPIEIVWWE